MLKRDPESLRKFHEELLMKVKQRKNAQGDKSLSNEQKPILSTTSSVARSLAPVVLRPPMKPTAQTDVKQLRATVEVDTQREIHVSAASCGAVMRENTQKKVDIYNKKLTEFNEALLKAAQSTRLPIDYLKYFLQIRVSQLLLSSHLIAIEHADASSQTVLKLDKHEARAINSIFMHVSKNDAEDFSKTISSISSSLSDKLIEKDVVLKKETIISREQANNAMNAYYEKIFATLKDRTKYVLPSMTKDGSYVSVLVANLINGIVEVKQSARGYFAQLEIDNAEVEEWLNVAGKDYSDLESHPQPEPQSQPSGCTIA